MIHLVTFATPDMEQSSWLCATSSKKHGVETHARFNPGNISQFPEVKAHPELFSQNVRAYGYWAWKPLIISKEMEWLPEGSTLIYSDAGIEFINNVSHIIDRMDQDIFLFGNNWDHAHWCKRDIMDAIYPELSRTDADGWMYPWALFGKQCQASVVFFRVSDYSKQFVAEWLKWCLFEGGRLIDDSPSRAPNHPEFRENRHDQAILTTLAYREGIKLHWWGARYNMDRPDGGFVYPKLPEYAADDYEPFVHHHRKRDHEWSNAT